jgi:hypothetical protein
MRLLRRIPKDTPALAGGATVGTMKGAARNDMRSPAFQNFIDNLPDQALDFLGRRASQVFTA